jgi:subtilisin-like proprotein convertase family protein
MFQHSSAGARLRRTRAAVTAAALAVAALGSVVVAASPASASTTFTNATALTVADAQQPCVNGCTPGLASSYPSNIVVSALSGTVSALTLSLHGVTHPFTGDFDVLLVGPAGQSFIVASDAGNNGGSTNADVTFSDAAAGVPSESAGWGNGTQTYKPFNYSDDPDVWPSPAPAGPYANADTGSSGSGALDTQTFAGTFNGATPNGTWSLYVVDDEQGGTGSISGGWSLSITTSAAVATTTSVVTSGSPSLTGASVTLTAHVVNAVDSSDVTAGTVAFTDGVTSLGAPVAVNSSGIATLTTTALAEGAHTITAAYTGNVSFGNSSGTVEQVVDHATTRTGQSYCNTGPISIHDASVAGAAGAAPYPSHIVVDGTAGSLAGLTVGLKGVTESFAEDLDVELVGPLGQKLMLVSDAGGSTAISNANVTFDDASATAFAAGSGGWGSGASSSKPVDIDTGTDAMPAPAPAGWSSPAPTGSATLASVFGGSSPNGTWSLYVADDQIDSSTGSMSGGWCLNLSVPLAAANDSYADVEGTVLTVAAPGVLGNDSGAPAPTVSTYDTTTVHGGTVSMGSDGGFSYTPPASFVGSDSFTYTASSGAGTSVGTVTVTVTPSNHAPLAAAGGPYTVVEGQPLHLDGSASSDADGDPLTYTWDVNGDGTFGDATGVAPTLTWAQLTALGVGDGPATFLVSVKVDDGKAPPVTSAATTLTVLDGPPVGAITGNPSSAAGLSVTLSFSAVDPSGPDQAAGFRYVIHWGDGKVDGPINGPLGGKALKKAHRYPAAGGYTVTMTATDKDGGVSKVVSKRLTVTVVSRTAWGPGKTLLVGGTPGGDAISIAAGPKGATVKVEVNGVTESVPSAGLARIVVNAGSGNDSVVFHGGLSLERIVYGGSGNDTLVAGNGPAVLLGGPGKDVLKGGPRRDILIGGSGSDTETGGAGDDILIDGATAFDAFSAAHVKALVGVQTEWTRTTVGFSGRISHLLAAGHGSDAGTHFVLSGRHRNLFSGGDRDVLDGGGGYNWILCNASGKGVLDVVHKHPHDRVTDL